MDALIDDTLFMYMRWMAAGNPAELAVYPGGIHAFNFFPIELARKANTKINEFINSVVG
jgi:acetyl esterase/lipase